jgi:hypothetical protein
MKRIRRVAPRTPQIASRQPHKYAGQACARAFSLYRPKNFRNKHNVQCWQLKRCDYKSAITRSGVILSPSDEDYRTTAT